jgi:glutaredoxin
VVGATSCAHHEAFAATDGADPEWPIWYADYLVEPLRSRLTAQLTRSRIVYCLIATEEERQARAPDSPWAEYYAQHFVECYARSAAPDADKLVLYQFASCPFCRRVRGVIDRLGIDVELRDILLDQGFRDELIAERGRATVPVLRITSPDASERWMPESSDIIAYLEELYGKPE